MSFSKAKIQRFNERGSEAPPPGSYDPKFDSKVKGIVLEKKERFPDNKSVCSNKSTESHVSTASKASSSQLANKAQLSLKKRVIVKPQFMSATKSKLHKSPRSPKITSKILSIHNATYKISDLKADCANKQKLLVEHEEQRKELEAQLEQYKSDCASKQKLIEEQSKQLEHYKKAESDLELIKNDSLPQISEETLNAQLLDLADLKEKENHLSTKLLQFETELAESRIQIDQLKSMKNKTKQELRNLLGEKEQHLLLLQKCSELSQKCDAMNFAEVEKSHDELQKLNTEIESFGTGETDKNQMSESALIGFKTILKSLLKSSSFVKTYMAETVLDTEYLYKDNEELRQQLEFESHTNQELTKNFRNIATDNEVLKKELKDVKGQLATKQKENQELLALIDDIRTQFKEIETLKAQQQTLIAKLEEEKMQLEDKYLTREKELEDVRKSMSIKVEEVKKHADKMIKNAEAVTRETLAACRSESEEKVKKIIAETDSKVNVMVQEARNNASEELRTTADKYAACLKKSESDKEDLEKKLLEKDTEINWLTSALEELKTTAETQESFSQSLQAELDRVETELAEKKEELRSLKDKIRSESAEMVSRRRRFEVVMTENQATINALVQRLAQSDAEVERLHRELKNTEMCMHEHRDLLNAMHNNSKLTNDQVFSLIDQLESKRTHIDQIEINNLADIESMRATFEKKIDNLKQVIGKEVQRLEEECRQKSSQNKELKHQLEQMTMKMKDAQELLVKLEERNDEMEIQVSKLELINSKLEQKLSEKEEHGSYESTIANQYKNEILQANKKISSLAECVEGMQQSITILQNEYSILENEKLKCEKNEQMLKESLEKEVSHRLKLEEQVETLSESCDRFKAEYQEISEKYSEILGHHNMKQKVKHVTQLKDKICSQQSEILRLKQELELKNKNIEHAKSNEKRVVYSKGKENVQNSSNPTKKTSLSRQTSTPLAKSTSTPLVSSSSPHGPLRHRNE